MDLLPSALRPQVTEFYRAEAFDRIATLPGIRVVQHRIVAEDRRFKLDCFSHVFGSGAQGIRIEDDLLLVNRPVQRYLEGSADVGSVVVYGDLVHVGRYLGNNRVRSKWDYGSVFEHPLELVPEEYGDSVRFFSRL